MVCSAARIFSSQDRLTLSISSLSSCNSLSSECPFSLWANSLRRSSFSKGESTTEPSIRIERSLPVPLSIAVTSKMQSAPMSKVTSICGVWAGAGGMPSRTNAPRK